MLTDDERKRFADWLADEAMTDERMMKQLAELGMNPAMDAMIKMRRAEIAAMRLIERRLRTTETDTVG